MTTFIDPENDVVRRGVLRELACKLTDEEFTRIAKTRATKEAEREQLEADLAREKKKRQDQISELSDEIALMGRELHTGEQARAVKCNEVFHRANDGVGYIVVVRLDDFREVERRAASPHETQRYLPSLEGGGILDDARRRQQQERSAQPVEEGADVPTDAELEAAVEGEGEGETEGAPDESDAPKKKRGRKGKE